MELSDQAKEYLARMSRDAKYTFTDEAVIQSYFKEQGIPVFPKIVEFQILYSGLILHLKGNPGHNFSAALCARKDIESKAPIDYFELNGFCHFYCGDHETAQFWFVISEEGEICTCENDRQTVYPWHTSFASLIETYAMEDWLHRSGKFESSAYYNVLDNSYFQNFIRDYHVHRYASDDYNEWYSKEDIYILKGPMLDGSGEFIHLYGDNEQSCMKVIGELERGYAI